MNFVSLESLLNLLLYNAKSHFFSLKSRQDVSFVVLGHKYLPCLPFWYRGLFYMAAKIGIYPTHFIWMVAQFHLNENYNAPINLVFLDHLKEIKILQSLDNIWNGHGKQSIGLLSGIGTLGNILFTFNWIHVLFNKWGIGVPIHFSLYLG